MALGRLREHAVPEVAEAVAERLRNGDQTARAVALETLGRLGKPAASHLEMIAAHLEDENAGVRKVSVEALWRLGDNALTQSEAIIARLQDSDEAVRKAAMKALSGFNIGSHQTSSVAEVFKK
eukprot:gene21393-25719_t